MTSADSHLPPRPSLEQLRKQAKDILRALRTGDVDVAARFARNPLLAARGVPEGARLSDAQLLVALEHGFASWPALAEHVDRLARDPRHARGGVAITPLYAIDWTADTLHVRRAPRDDEWPILVQLLDEFGLGGLDAGGHATDQMLERVVTLDRLARLDLQGSTAVSDDGLRHLARASALHGLDLTGCAVTDRGLAVLSELRGLRRFRLAHHTGVSDDGLRHLVGCDQLEDVDLRNTACGDGAVRALAGKSRLRRLHTGALLGDAGVALLHDLPVMKSWRGGDVSLSLMSPVAGPSFVGITLGPTLTRRALASLRGLEGLFALAMFAGASEITGADLDELSGLPHLGWLGCTETLCDDAAMARVAAIPRLQMLMCQDTVAGDAGFVALSRSTSIEYIWGRRCHGLGTRGFAALATMPALRGLSVSCKNVDDAGLATLPDFPALDSLMPIDVPDAAFRHIARCPRLASLYCMYCNDTTDEATRHLAATALETYHAFSTKITDASLAILADIASLERLLFYRCDALTDRGLAALARLPRLRQVDLSRLAGATPAGTRAFPPHVRLTWNTAG